MELVSGCGGTELPSADNDMVGTNYNEITGNWLRAGTCRLNWYCKDDKKTKDAGEAFAPTQSSDSDSGLGLDLAKVVVSLTDVYCLIFHP